MVYALDAAGGKPAWQQKMSGSVLGSPVLASGNLVVGTEAENVAFLDQSGTIVHTAAVSGKVYTTPAASGSLVLVALSNTVATAPILVAIDASGTQKWSFIPPK
jgi:outer membrane protein assembly factor BamB